MSEIEILVLLKKMQDQLISLERKVDALANKPQERSYNDRSYNKERSYPKPFVKYGEGPSQGKGQYGQSRPFQKRSGNDNRGYSPKKKPFFNKEGASR